MKMCQDCDGTGKIRPAFHMKSIECERCLGFGRVPNASDEWIEKGKLLKEQRLSDRIPLREKANQLRISVKDLSNAERGIMDPDTIIKP